MASLILVLLLIAAVLPFINYKPKSAAETRELEKQLEKKSELKKLETELTKRLKEKDYFTNLIKHPEDIYEAMAATNCLIGCNNRIDTLTTNINRLKKIVNG